MSVAGNRGGTGSSKPVWDDDSHTARRTSRHWTRRRRHTMTRLTVLALFAVAASLSADAQMPSGPLVAVDIGHTVDAPGAISARGRAELEFNHDLAHKVVAALEKLGLRTVVVNPDGMIASLEARPATVPDADFFLSIHHDSVSEWELQPWNWEGSEQTYSDRWLGHSMFVSRRNPDLATSLLCGSTIGARLQRLGFVPTEKNARRREYADPIHAVHYFDNLVVLYRATQPALLFEAGVIKHRDEELLLRNPQRQARMADAIATGIAACMFARRS
jgi:N-acetylmuramoyl-L-alanine amidase